MASVNPYNILGPVLIGGVGVAVLLAITGLETEPSFSHSTYEALPGQWAYTVMMRGLFVHSSMQDNVTYGTKAAADLDAKAYIATQLEGKP